MPPSPTGDPERPLCRAARQAVLAADGSAIGYELLFRQGSENRYPQTNSASASRAIIDLVAQLGTGALCEDGLAFINCTREVLLEGYVTALPPERVVVEILETVAPDASVRQACRDLKAAGYRIALDDYVADDPRELLCDLSDYIKVDLKQAQPDEVARIARELRGRNCALLAEKVETLEEFAFVREAGFQFFQGFLFCHPEMLPAQGAESSAANLLRFLHGQIRPDWGTTAAGRSVREAAALWSRLLRALNETES